MKKVRGSFAVVALLLAAGVVSVVAQSGKGGAKGKPYTTWTAYGGGAHSSQFTALDQINKTNVKSLSLAWTSRLNTSLQGAIIGGKGPEPAPGARARRWQGRSR